MGSLEWIYKDDARLHYRNGILSKRMEKTTRRESIIRTKEQRTKSYSDLTLYLTKALKLTKVPEKEKTKL